MVYMYLNEGIRFGTWKIWWLNWALEIYKREDNVNPPNFVHEIKTKGYDGIGANVFHHIQGY